MSLAWDFSKSQITRPLHSIASALVKSQADCPPDKEGTAGLYLFI